MEQIFFYILAAMTVIATVLAITTRHTVHAIIYLATSFFALAAIFYLLAAPLVAVFEVIIYAGAIMILFLFVIMMLDMGQPDKVRGPAFREWRPALFMGIIILGAIATLFVAHPSGDLGEMGIRRYPAIQPGAVPEIRRCRGGRLHAASVCPGRGALSGEEEKTMIVPLTHVLILAGIIFVLGLACAVAWRTNLIMILIGIEIMLNAAMLAFVGGAARWGTMDGQVFSLIIMALTSAEVSLALSLVVYLHRRRKTVNADDFSEMKG